MTASADVKKALALHFECLYLRLSQYGLADSSHEFAAGQAAQVLAIAQRHFHRPAHAPVIGELVEALKGIKVWAASYCPQKDYDAAEKAIAAGEAALAAGAVAGDAWLPIESEPKDGEQYLITDASSVIMAEHPNDERIEHDITSCGFGKATLWRRLPAAPSITKPSEDL